jgi:hypothetical protein
MRRLARRTQPPRLLATIIFVQSQNAELEWHSLVIVGRVNHHRATFQNNRKHFGDILATSAPHRALRNDEGALRTNVPDPASVSGLFLFKRSGLRVRSGSDSARLEWS